MAIQHGFVIQKSLACLGGQWGENPSLQVGPKEQGQSEFISIIMKVILNF